MGSTAEMAVPVTARAPMLTVLRPAPRRRVGFVAAFDLMEQGIGVYDLNGRLLHETTALRAIRTNGARARLIRDAVLAVASRVAAGRGDDVPAPVRMQQPDCVVLATLYQPSDEPMVLIHVNDHSEVQRPLSDDEVVAAYRLTPAELRVARMLAVGKSNKQIAFALGVSEHTTRHQTERVLRKMNVTSRSAVALKLSGG